MIYLDSSVVLSHLLAENRFVPKSIWDQALVSSRLLAYEVWNRIHARGLTHSHERITRALIGRVRMLELEATVLARALEPFPEAIATLDGLHLASIESLRAQGQEIELASFDKRMVTCAQALGIAILAL